MNTYFQLESGACNLLWLRFDSQNSSSNLLSPESLEALDQALVQAAQLHPAGLVLYSGKRNGFIVGADVNGFARVGKPEAVQQHIERVHEIFQRLEALAFPTVAMVHGFCLGGGLELALACRYRVASLDESTRFGFPEVRLGIFPGYGGTARSVRTVGDLAALQMMLSGRQLSAKAARKIGLIDAAVAERQLRRSAEQILLQAPKPQRASFWQRLPANTVLRPLVQHVLRQQVQQRVNTQHYPAPLMLLKHWRHNAASSKALYRGEARSVPQLLHSDSAQNLIRVFQLQERLKAFGKHEAAKAQRVHVVGAGIMGGDIAAWCAMRGLRVTLEDSNMEAVGRAMQRAHQLFDKRLRDPYRHQQARDRLSADPQGHGVELADVVIEAIFEDLDAKQSLLQGLQNRLKKHALLATNTSSIPLQKLAQGLPDEQVLVGLHFFNPVAKMPLLEIVHDSHTPSAELHRACAFARQIGKLPLPVKSSPGFLVNRILLPYLLEAIELVQEGVPAPFIDDVTVAFGMPMGPIELADSVGLDICLSVADKMSVALGYPVPKVLREYIEVKKCGKKCGEGIYRWIDGKPIKDPLRGRSPVSEEDTLDRLILRLVNESMACQREGVVADADLVDAGMIFGAGFAPFRGGPLHYGHRRGDREVSQRLQLFEKRYGEQFHADAGWMV